MLPLAMNEGGPVFAHSGHLDRKTRMRTSDPLLSDEYFIGNDGIGASSCRTAVNT